MHVLLHLLICTALRALIIVVEALYKINNIIKRTSFRDKSTTGFDNAFPTVCVVPLSVKSPALSGSHRRRCLSLYLASLVMSPLAEKQSCSSTTFTSVLRTPAFSNGLSAAFLAMSCPTRLTELRPNVEGVSVPISKPTIPTA